MSEYQYYEFLAVDRPLGEDEMRALRDLSTRARISSTGFVNHYDWGDFKGDPLRLVERHFDLFLYLANWGTRRLMLRLPRRFLDPEAAARYCVGESATVRTTGEHVILDFYSEEEEGDWQEDGQGRLAGIAPLRADLMRGDLRGLYLGWLLCAQNDLLEDDAEEPLRPAGLDRLSASLSAFADFLRLDEDLLAVAAEASGEVAAASLPRSGIEAAVRALPEDEKVALLLRAVDGDDPHLGLEIRRRLEAAGSGAGRPAQPGTTARRRAVDLLAAAERRAEERRRREAGQAAAEQARRERERAALRAMYLDELAPREAETWRQVDAMIATRQPAEYGRAVELLEDLRDLNERAGRREMFATRVRRLREAHARKSSLLQRFDRANLTV